MGFPLWKLSVAAGAMIKVKSDSAVRPYVVLTIAGGWECVGGLQMFIAPQVAVLRLRVSTLGRGSSENFRCIQFLRDGVEFLTGFPRLLLRVPSGEMGVPAWC